MKLKNDVASLSTPKIQNYPGLNLANFSAVQIHLNLRQQSGAYTKKIRSHNSSQADLTEKCVILQKSIYGENSP